ncbi:T9SS type A sorting domain-containing protein [Psychroserpens sp. AS72]|uniref:T9SS type A sorting domain-containing protein n=1 Tax=Psychroserpens sp. AS72 TaxID=3135775 RepID=UPI0031799774
MKIKKLRLTILSLTVFASLNYSALSQAGVEDPQLTWNGSISSDWDNPNNWTPNETPSEWSEITIPSTANDPLITGVKTVEDITISSGSSMTIPVGATLNVNGDVNMYSQSNSYASLIVNGTISISGTAKYHRFTNSQSNNNDLIAPPLSGQTWSSFLTSDTNYNEGLIFNNGVQPMTTYLFGPFEKGITDDYLLYNDNSSEVLVSGKGYRTASNTVNGDALIFTGTIVTGAVTTTIVNDLTGAYSEWNLIGNPYPAYIEVEAFLNHVGSVTGVTNLSLLNASSAAIYGYSANTTGTGDSWTIVNLATGSTLIAPGQGFFVTSNLPVADLEFTPDMQVAGNVDDFIQGRSSDPINFVNLKMRTATNSALTSVYFNDNASNGLDVGYDAVIFGGQASNFGLYSHLVQDNEGLPLKVQTLNSNVANNVIIPLGINANQGQQVTFSLEDFYVPASVEIYLEDNLNGTFTLLNESDYTFTTNTTINGTGRFFLHFETDTLSLEDNSLNALQIFTNQIDRTIEIEGVLLGETEASIYNLLGNKVIQHELDSAVTKQVINANRLSSGVYLVHIQNGTQKITKKIILK